MATVLEIDATTNTATERPETADEIANRTTIHKQFLAEIQNTKNKQIAKLVLLAKLGITADEAALLG